MFVCLLWLSTMLLLTFRAILMRRALLAKFYFSYVNNKAFPILLQSWNLLKRRGFFRYQGKSGVKRGHPLKYGVCDSYKTSGTTWKPGTFFFCKNHLWTDLFQIFLVKKPCCLGGSSAHRFFFKKRGGGPSWHWADLSLCPWEFF